MDIIYSPNFWVWFWLILFLLTLLKAAYKLNFFNIRIKVYLLKIRLRAVKAILFKPKQHWFLVNLDHETLVKYMTSKDKIEFHIYLTMLKSHNHYYLLIQ